MANMLASATWPVGFVAALFVHTAAPASGPDARATKTSPFASWGDHISAQMGCLPRLALAVWLFSTQLRGWETFAQHLAWSWVLPIFARNLCVAWVVGTVTDTLLLASWSPFRPAMAKHKYNERYAHLFSRNQTGPIARDVFWSSVSACVAAAGEVALLHACASGRIAFHAGPWWRHWPTVLLMASWFYTQNVQFYAMHRCMHPWGIQGVPDVGAWLYKHVHALHHVSRNPTAWSGISMHPVESALFFSYALFPALFGAHPIACVYIEMNLICAALLGHSGFANPAGGSHPHYLHHVRSCCVGWVAPPNVA